MKFLIFVVAKETGLKTKIMKFIIFVEANKTGLKTKIMKFIIFVEANETGQKTKIMKFIIFVLVKFYSKIYFTTQYRSNHEQTSTDIATNNKNYENHNFCYGLQQAKNQYITRSTKTIILF